MRVKAAAAIAGIVLAMSVGEGVMAQAQKTPYTAELQQFRDDRAKGLQAPDGWLSLVGLEWLSEGTNTVGSAPENSVKLPKGAPARLAVIQQLGKVPGAKLAIAPPAGGYPADFTIDNARPQSGPLAESATLRFGTFTVTLIPRGDKLGLRIKDTNSPTRVHFKGLKWYGPNPAYRVQAKWIPYVPEHEQDIGTIIGTTLHEKVPGAAEFVLQGKTLRLEPVIEDKQLFFIVRDVTSRTTTYGAARFLYTDFPPNGLDKPGELTLDFNKLRNPPCAYTDFATCPLPPPQNRLQVAIQAGEKRYREE